MEVAQPMCAGSLNSWVRMLTSDCYSRGLPSGYASLVPGQTPQYNRETLEREPMVEDRRCRFLDA